MEQVIMTAKGVNGTLELLEDRVRIRRDGFTAPLYDRHKRAEMLLQQIHCCELGHKAGGLAGYLAIHDDDGAELLNDFCVTFVKPQEPQFDAIRREIETRRDAIIASHPTARMHSWSDNGAR